MLITPTEKTKRNDMLKLIALISMVIDHIGLFFFPKVIFLRILGRLAFPIFAHGIVFGYENTGNIKKYAVRLAIFGMISQVPYTLYIGKGLNIFFTLLIGLICIYLIENNKILLLLGMIGLSLILPLDYGLYGIFSIIIFYILRDKKYILAAAQILLCFLFSLFTFKSLLQMYSLLSLLIIFNDFNLKINLNKYFFYVFYPTHIFILGILSIII